MGKEAWIRFVMVPNFSACCGKAPDGSSVALDFSLQRLGHGWFNRAINKDMLALIIHELAHYYVDGDEAGHLSSAYHQACCDLGAGLAMLALEDAEFFTNLRNPVPVHDSKNCQFNQA